MPGFSEQQYLKDILDFFHKSRGGHLDGAAYRTPQHWTEIVRAAEDHQSSYYLADPDTELALLQELADEKSQFNNGGKPIRSLFEIGAGTGEKILPFVKGNDNLSNITLIDYEVGLNKKAHDRIRKVNPDIPITLLEQDFSNNDNSAQVSGGRVLGLILGGTISNISALPSKRFFKKQAENGDFLIDSLSRRFANAANFYHDRGELVVTLDTGSPEQALEAYKGDEHANFIYGALELATDLLETDFSKEDIRRCFVHKPRIVRPTEDSWGIAHTLECVEPLDITINGEEIYLEEGFKNSIINSFKPSPDQLRRAAEMAGFEFKDKYTDETGRVSIMHFSIDKVANDHSEPEDSLDARQYGSLADIPIRPQNAPRQAM